MGQIGFTTYVTPELLPRPTLKERLEALSGSEKTAILDGFSEKTLPNRLKHEISIPLDLIREIYTEIDNIEETARLLMREEIVIEEATYDEEGNELTPAEYNIAPATINELKLDVSTEFDEIFSEAEVGAVVDRIISYSELDADGLPIGTAVVYSEEIIK